MMSDLDLNLYKWWRWLWTNVLCASSCQLMQCCYDSVCGCP